MVAMVAPTATFEKKTMEEYLLRKIVKTFNQYYLEVLYLRQFVLKTLIEFRTSVGDNGGKIAIDLEAQFELKKHFVNFNEELKKKF